MSGPYRVPAAARERFGARIDRSEPVGFRLDGKVFNGFYGDTLESALLASGVSTFGASPLLGRPRGPMSLDVDAPTPVLVGDDGSWRPASAGDVVVREGLKARLPGQASAALRRLAPVAMPEDRALPTASRLIERLRQALPMPAPRLPRPAAASPARYERCDALVIGAGLAGLSAGLALRTAGLDVRIVEADRTPGGLADLYDGRIDGKPLAEWAQAHAAGFAGRQALTLRATAVSIAADGAVTVIERVGVGDAPVLRVIWAGAVVLATGHRERPMAFAENDRPGVIFAVAARALLRRHAIAPGSRVLVATTCDEGYRAAMDLREAGVAVDFVIDQRDQPEGPAVEMAKALGAPVSLSSVVTGLEYDAKRGAITGVRVRNRYGEGASAGARVLPADALVVAGGFTPRDELARASGLGPEQGLRLAFDGPNAVDAVAGGWRAGVEAAAQLGATLDQPAPAVEATSDEFGEAPSLEPASFAAVGANVAFADIGADVSLADLARAVGRRGPAPAAIARRLGLGSGPDCGRLSADLPGLALAALGVNGADPPGPAAGRLTLAQRAARAV
ncbi:FAD-dependent oxidoreductase [Chelatococcus sambhunathii]|uniref:FAD-dependent oxidoreductase n=1 Tax=Chelatococcus sambhunathii TaxID=363953 RepID=A0ABU1DJT0_9HYPH|nr:FAD-dependent oxidoreductase [Chelatococcus sambhunathii]MDR4308385.1 FAD-dependent oxidoreductase [Chelatococcus sambhunathii]